MMEANTGRSCGVALGLLLLFPLAVAAQLEVAAFQGTVRDDRGQPLAAATLRLRDLGRGGEVSFKTDKKGFFYRRGVQPGDYELTIEREGFQPFRDHLRFRPGEEKRLDFRLGSAVDPAVEAFNRGIERFNQGDFAGAAEAFGEAARQAPDSPEAQVNLGLAYLKLGRAGEGIGALERALSLKPGDRQVELQLAAAYAEAKQVDKAIGLFEQALARFADRSDPLAVEAGVTLGALYFGAGRVEEALAAYEKVLAARSNSAAALLGLGKCHFNKGATEKALEYFERAVAVAPDSPEAAQSRQFIEGLKKDPPR